MSIHTFIGKIKGWGGENRHSLVVGIVLVLTVLVSFYLGYAARSVTAKTQYVNSMPVSAGVHLQEPQKAVQEDIPAIRSVSQNTVQSQSVVAEKGSFVASKNGTKYYAPNCGGVSRIKEENKVWFASESEAQAAGYTRAKGC